MTDIEAALNKQLLSFYKESSHVAHAKPERSWLCMYLPSALRRHGTKLIVYLSADLSVIPNILDGNTCLIVK